MPTVRSLSESLILEAGFSAEDDEFLSQIDGWVIKVIQKIALEWDWDELRTSETIATVASQAEYELQSSASTVLSARIPSLERDVVITTREELEHHGIDLEEESSPVRYMYPSGFDADEDVYKYKFYPIPSDVQSIELQEIARVDNLTSDSDIPFPPKFIPLIEAGTRKRIHIDKLQFVSAQDDKAEYQELLESLKNRSSQVGRRLVKQESDVPRRGHIGVRFPSHYENH